MPTVRVTYEGGLHMDFDAVLRQRAEVIGAQSLGSGQILVAPYTRDLSWRFGTAKKARAFATFVVASRQQFRVAAWVAVD